MDVLLAIPIVTACVSPSWPSSSTLFFYWTKWASRVLAHHPTTIHVAGVVILRAIFWLMPSLILLAFGYLIPSVAGSLGFPGAAARPRRPLHLLALSILNVLLMAGVEGVISYAFKHTTRKALFPTTMTLPYVSQMFKHTVILLIAREVLAYYTHRFLLHANQRSPLASLHSRYAHANLVSSLQLYADHPLPLLTLYLVAVFLPCALLRPHLVTYLWFTGLCAAEGTLTTSGYNIIPGIVLSAVARRTAAHYASGGSANYGPWGLLDWAHATSWGGGVEADVRRSEAGKRNAKERSAQKADDGTRLDEETVDAVTGDTGPRKSGRKRTAKNAGQDT